MGDDRHVTEKSDSEREGRKHVSEAAGLPRGRLIKRTGSGGKEDGEAKSAGWSQAHELAKASRAGRTLVGLSNGREVSGAGQAVSRSSPSPEEREPEAHP